MIATYVISGPTMLGAADFVKGTHFNCTSTICYGIGTANHQLFIQLQREINKFAAKAGFAKIGEDGKLGSGTASAAQKAARFILSTMGAWSADPTLAQVSAGTTKEVLATKVPTLIEIFSRAAAGQGPVVAVEPVTPTEVTPARPVTPGQVTTPTRPVPPAQPAQPTQPVQPTAVPPIFARAAEVLDVCRTDPNQPICNEARAACRQLATTPVPMSQADAERVQLVCAGIPAPLAPTLPPAAPTKPAGVSPVVWWIVGGAGVLVVGGVIIALAVRRPRPSRWR